MITEGLVLQLTTPRICRVFM